MPNVPSQIFYFPCYHYFGSRTLIDRQIESFDCVKTIEMQVGLQGGLGRTRVKNDSQGQALTSFIIIWLSNRKFGPILQLGLADIFPGQENSCLISPWGKSTDRNQDMGCWFQ
jgi:hypothetical protein